MFVFVVNRQSSSGRASKLLAVDFIFLMWDFLKRCYRY